MDNRVKFNNSPEVIGPGIWWTLTRMAVKSTTNESIQQFKKVLHDIIYHFPCLECRPHAIAYYESHPTKEYESLANGMYTYMWIFHNAVNKRLGKPEIDWESGFHIHNDNFEGVCTEGCGDSQNDNEPSNEFNSGESQSTYHSNLNTKNVHFTFTPR